MGNSAASSPLIILSRAGRLASGWSLPAEGDEGVSRGRFVDCVGAAAGGEADILLLLIFTQGGKVVGEEVENKY